MPNFRFMAKNSIFGMLRLLMRNDVVQFYWINHDSMFDLSMNRNNKKYSGIRFVSIFSTKPTTK